MSDPLDMEVYIQKMKQDPSQDDISEFLEFYRNTNASLVLNLQVMLVLIDYTIPQVFKLLDNPVKQDIVQTLRCLPGIGGLINRIDSGLNHGSGTEQIETFLEVLEMCFNDDLSGVLTALNPNEINEANKLLFKGKAFEAVNKCRVEGIDFQSKIFHSADSYVHFLGTLLVRSSINTELFNKFFLSVLSLNDSSYTILFDIFFCQSNWECFRSHFVEMSRFQKKTVLSKLLAFLAKRNFGSVDALVLILRGTLEVDASLVERAFKLQNKRINQVLAFLNHSVLLFQTIFKTWANPSSIKTDPIVIQHYRTHFLIQMINLLPKSFSETLLSDPSFLEAVSNRLGSYSNAVKVFGVILADQVCDVSKKEKIFLIQDLDGYEGLKLGYLTELQDFSQEMAWKNLNLPEIEDSPMLPITSSMGQLDLTKTYKDSDDESDSEDSDDPSIVLRAKLTAPIYIKELISYLKVDAKHPQGYEMVKLALASGPTLIRKKSQFGSEISANSVELLQTLVGLQDQFLQENFDDLKLNNVIAVLVSYPPSALDLIKMLGTGDYSLQQRLLILSALSLAARDIRGFRDEVVSKSYKEQTFPTKQLPPQLHARYLALDAQRQLLQEPESLKQAHLLIQDSLILEQAEDAKDELAGGKILRISRRMQPKQQQLIKARYTDYSKLIQKYFYFPLAHLWFESGGINIGHYSAILTGHYVKTMALLLHSSYASVTNNDMIREFFLIADDLSRHTPMSELQVVEGIVTGVLLICDISDEEHLVTNFGDYLANIQGWISESWDSIIDERIKSLCAGFMLRLNNILQKYQATVMDQLNSIY